MRSVLNLLWTIHSRHFNHFYNHHHHHHHHFIYENICKRCIHSALRMTSQEVATALRPFIFTVHPDRFWNHPKEKNTNEISLKRLNEFLGDKNDGKTTSIGEETITFYILNKEGSRSNEKSALNKFEKVDIKLNSKENVSTTVHRILSQCSLPTDYLKKISQEPIKRNNNPSRNNNSYNDEWPTFYRRRGNEYFYSKDIFDDLEAELFRSNMEINLSKWLKENHSLAMKKLEASQPIRIELTRLKQELIDELKLINLEWNCDWTASHIRGALKNLSILSKQYPEDFKKLHSKTVVFSRHNCVSFKGQVILSIEDVRNNWLYLIRSIKSYDFYVQNIPHAEKKLSGLLQDITIKQPEYNLWNAKKYFNQLERFIRSVQSYNYDRNFPSNWPASLAEHQLIVESDSGPLMLSPTGDFIVPASCPISLLIKFIMENLHKANRLIDKEEFNLEHERVIRKECIETFQMKHLDKDVNITPEQMIDFCRRILNDKQEFEDYLKNAHIQVSMYYSVMHDGQICVPFNFIK
ncbi:T-cell activation inhibitor, mitochondrial [Dermatophagoides farinae]|nr:T-cell activation inhibitor, mitochondrial-like [Dermatophagoides farinae]